ncbi:RusA family crossover junction endodeoxyribonuclease [Caballeronia sp. Sq4a]|uniref:RusA family crossover junction endodeoxyribonuclease n=1 Tax=Caballeronia sp. Sq4a TaxID=2878152 RepID=UPI0020C110A5|nr:RusA family crossover junction endodeoxyribonuclease [Caballeronia sp. Sq4a]
MSAVCFSVPGEPVAKGRARFARRGNFVTTYTPEKTAKYENLVRLAAQQAMCGQPPFQRPVSLLVQIWVGVPASWSKKRREQALRGFIGATKKPDADNVLKAIKDGMNGVVYVDDARVTSITLSKQYGEIPRVEVRASEYTEREAA